MCPSVGLGTNDISGALAYLATPGHAGEALVAESVELASDRTAGAGAAAILDDGDDEFGMHGGSFDGGELRQVAGFRCCASQDAPQCQDAVTTWQDSSRTCQDVCAAMKPSFHVYALGNASGSCECFYQSAENAATLLERSPFQKNRRRPRGVTGDFFSRVVSVKYISAFCNRFNCCMNVATGLCDLDCPCWCIRSVHRLPAGSGPASTLFPGSPPPPP